MSRARLRALIEYLTARSCLPVMVSAPLQPYRSTTNSQSMVIETTATTTTWVLWEIAKQPKIQATLRAEIRDFLRAALETGENTIPVTNYDKMPYTQAVLKVVIYILV